MFIDSCFCLQHQDYSKKSCLSSWVSYQYSCITILNFVLNLYILRYELKLLILGRRRRLFQVFMLGNCAQKWSIGPRDICSLLWDTFTNDWHLQFSEKQSLLIDIYGLMCTTHTHTMSWHLWFTVHETHSLLIDIWFTVHEDTPLIDMCGLLCVRHTHQGLTSSLPCMIHKLIKISSVLHRHSQFCLYPLIPKPIGLCTIHRS